MKRLIAILALLVVPAFANPAVLTIYMDAAAEARMATFLPIAPGMPQYIEVFAWDLDGAAICSVRIDYVDPDGNAQFQQMDVPNQDGTAIATFFGVDNVTLLKTTATANGKTTVVLR